MVKLVVLCRKCIEKYINEINYIILIGVLDKTQNKSVEYNFNTK